MCSLLRWGVGAWQGVWQKGVRGCGRRVSAMCLILLEFWNWTGFRRRRVAVGRGFTATSPTHQPVASGLSARQQVAIVSRQNISSSARKTARLSHGHTSMFDPRPGEEEVHRWRCVSNGNGFGFGLQMGLSLVSLPVIFFLATFR